MFYDEKWLKEKFESANQSSEAASTNIRDSFSKAFEALDAQRDQLSINNRLTNHDNSINRIEHKQDALFDCLLDTVRQIHILQDQNNKLADLVKILTQPPPQPQVTPIPGRGRKVSP